MAIVANTYAYVIGVDAHAMTPTFAAVESRTGPWCRGLTAALAASERGHPGGVRVLVVAREEPNVERIRATW